MNKWLATLIAGAWAVGALAQAPADITVAPPAIHKLNTASDLSPHAKKSTEDKKALHHSHKAHKHLDMKADKTAASAVDKPAVEKK